MLKKIILSCSFLMFLFLPGASNVLICDCLLRFKPEQREMHCFHKCAKGGIPEIKCDCFN